VNGETLEKPSSYGRRAASYWFVDGLPELLFGLTVVLFSVLGLLLRIDAPARWMRAGDQLQPDSWIFFAGLALYFCLERRLLDVLKSRVTYPRTGYVSPPEEQERKVETLIVLNLHPVPPPKGNVTYFRLRTEVPVSAFAWLFWLNGNPLDRWLAPSLMPAMAITLFLANRKSDHPYSWKSTLILGLTGPALLLINVPAYYQLPLPSLLVGAWLSTQGVFALIHYLQANPYPRNTAEGRA
jgi:hypothetical protein